ncbi:hypothetical protein HY490_05140 [Candidatus Woesearchaeota archaeon]|nr:hypothetical protein [Candidatus Woesearchaeota archaeon]
MSWIERRAFAYSLHHPWFFRYVVRPQAYRKANGDQERVHDLALEALVEYEDALRAAAEKFDFPDLHVPFCGKKVSPFGTAAGLDKNGEALLPLSHIFGFIEWGTVVLHERKGNNRPRVAVDNKKEEIYNAQGFPHKGLAYALAKAQAYAAANGKADLITSVCGIPPSPDKIDVAYEELETLVRALEPYSSGFVWNPYSPNTDALKALRTPEHFHTSAELIRKIIGQKLLLVKMGPYETEMRETWLQQIAAWLEGRGDGIVAVNTYIVSRDHIPCRQWGYPSAGRSGTNLQAYRQRAICDARSIFPKIFIAAAGGINSGNEAWRAIEAGANVLEAYTPFTFHGFGILLDWARTIQKNLHKKGYRTLKEYQLSNFYIH